jgi:hypothetical protein
VESQEVAAQTLAEEGLLGERVQDEKPLDRKLQEGQ